MINPGDVRNFVLHFESKSLRLDQHHQSDTSESAAIQEFYCPFGYWGETNVFEDNKLASNLTTIQSELQKMGESTEAKK